MAILKVKQKKGKRKKAKFVKIVFRIPKTRKNQLEVYCRSNNTTPRIALRRIINSYLDEKTPIKNGPSVPKNQLTLFDLMDYDNGGIQTAMDF
ncbi:MAG: hypothetical protein WCP69_05070 [Bacteroidota bacterium]|jgi:hypothetical protein